MKKSNSTLVYSCSSGHICPNCGKPLARCSCRQPGATPLKGDGVVRVGRETKGRKGKGVTVISGVPLPAEDLKLLARELKQKCGSGGTVKDGVIEVQGDHRDSLIELLKSRGWAVKRSGG
jgi:translation initiation factor 1